MHNSVTQQNKLYTQLVAGQASLVYFVQGINKGRDAWHYVLIEKARQALFLGKLKSGNLDVAQYGKILYSGWGNEAPAYVLEEIEARFNP